MTDRENVDRRALRFILRKCDVKKKWVAWESGWIGKEVLVGTFLHGLIALTLSQYPHTTLTCFIDIRRHAYLPFQDMGHLIHLLHAWLNSIMTLKSLCSLLRLV